jgi:hypothetical protein
MRIDRSKGKHNHLERNFDATSGKPEVSNKFIYSKTKVADDNCQD